MKSSEKIDRALELTAELFNTIVEIEKDLGKVSIGGYCHNIHNIQDRLISLAYRHKIELKTDLRK